MVLSVVGFHACPQTALQFLALACRITTQPHNQFKRTRSFSCVYVHAHVHTCTHAHKIMLELLVHCSIYEFTYTHTGRHACVPMSTDRYANAGICTYMHACMHAYVYPRVHEDILAYIHTYIYTCIHTYILAHLLVPIFMCLYVCLYLHILVYAGV